MKRKTAIRFVSYCLAAVLTVTGFLIAERSKTKSYRQRLQNQYSSALSELNSRLNNIGDVLQKAAYVSSAKQISSYAAELYSDAELAKNALSRLPDGGREVETVYKFLSQVGNFAMSVSKKVISGDSVTDEQRQTVSTLKKVAETVSAAVEGVQLSIDNTEGWSKEIAAAVDGVLDESALASALTEMEENISDYPTLIYDGPYSDHILSKKSLMLENAEQIDKEAARSAATEMLGDGVDLQLEDTYEGNIPSYRFTGGNSVISVSRSGGYIVYMRREKEISQSVFSYDQALSKAQDFMKKNGLNNMIDTYYFTDEGICVINFAFLDGQTVCYTDLIKVGVAMDDGEIVLYEASGYLTNHTERAFETPLHTSEEAAGEINDALDIEKTSLALIPTDSGQEVRCYEFLCHAENGEAILIYINAATLEGEQVFILLETEGGSLVK